MTEKRGITAAIAAVMEDYEEPEDEQLDLLGLPEPASPAAREFMATRRGPGRPPGARNKRTERTVQWLLSRFEDPRAVLLAIAQTPVDQLMASLSCSALEALQEKRLAAIGVLPYIAQRQPLAVDLTDRKVVYLTINEAPASASAGNDLGLTARVVDAVIETIAEEENADGT